MAQNRRLEELSESANQHALLVENIEEGIAVDSTDQNGDASLHQAYDCAQDAKK